VFGFLTSVGVLTGFVLITAEGEDEGQEGMREGGQGRTTEDEEG
jgi:hypothetical protein